MAKNEITINGKTYPVAVNMKLIVSYEQISGKSFFSEDFQSTASRLALICAAVIATGTEDTPSIDDMLNADSVQSIMEIMSAYALIIGMVSEFFKTPDIEKGAEKKEEGKQAKN